MTTTVEQQGAVNDALENNVIVAAPGAGKTYTLVQIAKKILSQNATNKICLVTFTNAGVKEMHERLQAELSSTLFKRVKIKTFHALFLEQSRSSMVGTLLIGGSQINFLERLKRQLGLDPTDDISNDIEDVGMELDRSKFDHTREGEIYAAYEKLKMANKKYDLNDVARYAVIGMIENRIEPLNFTNFLVDEFQDTDELQYRWLAEHNRKTGANVTVVADDDQSIYSFRGALGYDIMLRFQNETGANLHLLSTCFRCRPEILAAGYNMIEFNENRIPKNVKSSKEAGGVVEIYTHESDVQQYEVFNRDYIENPGEWAVLCRTNKLLDTASLQLTSYNIKHRIANAKSIWDTNQADFVLKFLYCIRFPQLGVKYIPEILGFLRESENTIIELEDRVIKSNGLHNIKLDAGENLAHATEIYFGYYQDWIDNTHDESTIRTKVETIKALLSLAKNGRATSKATMRKNIGIESSVLDILYGCKGSWHERIDVLLTNLNKQKNKNEKHDENEVVLTTFHGSKGLEWENLAIFDFMQGVSPSNKSLEADAATGTNKGLAEERRLAFVAITRAKEKLYIHSYEKRVNSETGDSRVATPSEFIEEIVFEN